MALLAPAFLLGLLAIGLPLWLHRFARETREKKQFASLMLVEASQTHRSRHHQLRYLLLLALRIALLVLLVLAFTEPVFPWRTPPLNNADRTLHIIALDTSLSMQQGERWARALERASSLIDSLSPGDRAMLVAADSRVRIVNGPVEQNAAANLRGALASIKPTFARLDYGMLMTSAASWIGTDAPTAQLHLITDMQQSASPLQFADLMPPPGVQLRLVDVGDARSTNLRITAVNESRQDANAIEVQIKGSQIRRAPRDVVLTVDGEVRGRKPISAPASGDARTGASGPETPGIRTVRGLGADLEGLGNAAASGIGADARAAIEAIDTRVTFAGLQLGIGEHRVVATLEPSDGLPQDDRFYTVLERSEPKVLILGANSAADDVAYFAAAVGSLTNPRLAVERGASDSIGGRGVGQRALPDYSTLIVSDVGILSSEAIDAIQTYLNGGGAVLMTLGPRAAALDAVPIGGQRTDGRTLESRDSNAAPFRVAAVDQSHPALRDAQGWRSVRFPRHTKVEPRADDSVLIRFENGDPLLLERKVGAGRLLILTAPLDREWNDLAVHPLFVRFIGDAAHYLTGSAAPANTMVGTLLATEAIRRSGAQVFDPSGRRVLALGDTAATSRLLADQVGFYEVRGGGRSDWIAVNVDPRESDLARMPAASIERWLTLRTPLQISGGESPAAEASAVSLKSIWPWLLLVAATLALAEALVANSHLHVRRGAPN